jgi:hypothetical protein
VRRDEQVEQNQLADAANANQKKFANHDLRPPLHRPVILAHATIRACTIQATATMAPRDRRRSQQLARLFHFD